MSIILDTILPLFSVLDAVALGLLVLALLGMGFAIENSAIPRASTTRSIERYRKLWMRQMITREPRMFDANILDSMRQGTTFFATGCMIAIGGALALLDRTDQLQGMTTGLVGDFGGDALFWEVKILVVIVFLANGFLKFVWAHRLFGYCSVVMAAVPNDASHADAIPLADKAATLANLASRSFNRGLRAVYFSLALMAWLLGPFALLTATATTSWVLLRREFASKSRAELLGG
ncbi:MAG: DUF599 domain-containing protein [Rhodobacteraceae bacterium]|nr:DUF599 domain-containing protein [Paracoccaceae bacterium]